MTAVLPKDVPAGFLRAPKGFNAHIPILEQVKDAIFPIKGKYIVFNPESTKNWTIPPTYENLLKAMTSGMDMKKGGRMVPVRYIQGESKPLEILIVGPELETIFGLSYKPKTDDKNNEIEGEMGTHSFAYDVRGESKEIAAFRNWILNLDYLFCMVESATGLLHNDENPRTPMELWNSLTWKSVRGTKIHPELLMWRCTVNIKIVKQKDAEGRQIIDPMTQEPATITKYDMGFFVHGGKNEKGEDTLKPPESVDQFKQRCTLTPIASVPNLWKTAFWGVKTVQRQVYGHEEDAAVEDAGCLDTRYVTVRRAAAPNAVASSSSSSGGGGAAVTTAQDGGRESGSKRKNRDDDEDDDADGSKKGRQSFDSESSDLEQKEVLVDEDQDQ